jgi:hypothetical protein
VPKPPLQVQPWKPITRLAFRFCVVYLGLFSLATQITGSMIPNLSFYYRGMGRLWPMRDLTVWVASHFFGVTSLEDPATGGEPMAFWVQSFWVLLVAIVATAIWSTLDRRRPNYDALHKWFRLFVRFALAAAMFEYGMTKVIPTQFPPPSLETLVTPVGDMTLSALLWASIGASPAYEIFTGCIEVLGGLLLLVPRTTLLGALISLGAMTQVFALNMTFDVGLKLISFHLILLALFLIAPDVPRLVSFFWRNKESNTPADHALFTTPRSNRMALVAQIVFGAYLISTYAYINVGFWSHSGGNSPRSPLYGIWNVEVMAINGESRPVELNDYDRRWRRVVFDAPTTVVFQRTDESFARYGGAIDAEGKTLTLSKGGSKNWKASFVVERPSGDRLILDGEWTDNGSERSFG